MGHLCVNPPRRLLAQQTLPALSGSASTHARHPGHLANPINSHSPRGTLLGHWPPRLLPGLRAWAARLTLCAPARLGDRLPSGVIRTQGRSRQHTSSALPGGAHGLHLVHRHNLGQGLRQVPSAQLSPLPDPDQPGQPHAPHRQVLQEARGASGQPAGRSWCAPVNPAGPSGSLWVPASGSEQPGQQHPVYRQCRR